MSRDELCAHVNRQLGRWVRNNRDFNLEEMKTIDQITNRCKSCLGEMVESTHPAALVRCPNCKSTDIKTIETICQID